MSVDALSAANGADLLQQYVQSTQGGRASATGNTMAVLKTALAEAQLSASSIINGGEPISSGSLLNVFG